MGGATLWRTQCTQVLCLHPLLPIRRRPSFHASSHQSQEVCFEFCFDDIVFHFFFSISCPSLLDLRKERNNTQVNTFTFNPIEHQRWSLAEDLHRKTTTGLLQTRNLFYSQKGTHFCKLVGCDNLLSAFSHQKSRSLVISCSVSRSPQVKTENTNTCSAHWFKFRLTTAGLLQRLVSQAATKHEMQNCNNLYNCNSQ